MKLYTHEQILSVFIVINSFKGKGGIICIFSICESENGCATMVTCLNGTTGPAESEGTVNFVTDNIPEGIDLPDVTHADCNGTVNIIPDYVFGGIDLNLTVTGLSDILVLLILLLMLLVVLIY